MFTAIRSQRRLSEPTASNSPDFPKEKCRCGLEAALKVSSAGRRYLGCSRKPTAGQCEFTRMLDNVQEGTSSALSNPAERTAISVESQNENDPNFTTPGAVTAMKRTPPSMENDDFRQLLPSQKRARITEATRVDDSLSDSQKRTIAIQVALCNPDPDDEIPLSAFPKPIPALLGGVNVSSQGVRAEDISSCCQSIGSSSGTTGSSTLDGAPSSRAVDADNDWLLLQTPKRTEFEGSAAALSSPEQSPVQVAKGKHKADEECHSAKAAVALSEDSSFRKRYSAASISHSLEDLSGLPNYLRTLEKGHEIKDMKIRHLENEVERLKGKQGELEKLLQIYEQHSPLTDQHLK